MRYSLIKLGLCLLVLLVLDSCKRRKKINPFGDACPLIGVTDENGQRISEYEYVGAKLIRIYNLRKPKTNMSFKYNEKDQLSEMKVENEDNTDDFLVKFFYNDEGQLSETVSNILGLDILKNTFTISENKYVKVNTTVSLFGQEVKGETKIEYSNDNVSKVYTSVNGEPQMLAFAGDVYDNMPQYHPEVYKLASLGFVGINNQFFNYLSKNNLVLGRIYNEEGVLDQKSSLDYKYDKSGMPKEISVITERGEEKASEKLLTQFLCP